jgi:hypothetical protein
LEVLVSNLGSETDYPEVLRCFSQSVQTAAAIAPRPLPSTSLPIQYSPIAISFDTVFSKLLKRRRYIVQVAETASLNKLKIKPIYTTCLALLTLLALIILIIFGEKNKLWTS